MAAPIAASTANPKGKIAVPRRDIVTGKFTNLGHIALMNDAPNLRPRRHARTRVSLEVTVNGVLNVVEGRITDLSEGGAQVEGGVIMPERSRCEVHFGGQTIYAVVMWTEVDRMGLRFPYELVDGPLFKALERARGEWQDAPVAAFRSMRPTTFGRRGLN